MLRRSLLFFSKPSVRQYANGSPIHRTLLEKLSELSEEYRNIKSQLEANEITRYLINNFGEENHTKTADTTSFDNGLRAHKEKLSNDMIALLAEIRKEYEHEEEDSNTCLTTYARR